LTGNEFALFVDGLKGTDASVGVSSISALSGSMGFGYHKTTSCPGWGGQLRNAFMWVDKALPDSAYEAMANGVHPLVFAPTHWWPMDNTLVDLVGGNPLTNMGANVSHSTAQSTPHIALPSGILVPSSAVGITPTFKAFWAAQATITHNIQGT